MDREIKTWLFDILQSIAEVESYYETKPKKFEDWAYRRLVEIIVIGQKQTPLYYSLTHFQAKLQPKVLKFQHNLFILY